MAKKWVMRWETSHTVDELRNDQTQFEALSLESALQFSIFSILIFQEK
jgi:hypothetical protein